MTAESAQAYNDRIRNNINRLVEKTASHDPSDPWAKHQSPPDVHNPSFKDEYPKGKPNRKGAQPTSGN